MKDDCSGLKLYMYILSTAPQPYLHYTEMLLCLSFKVKIKNKYYKLFKICHNT